MYSWSVLFNSIYWVVVWSVYSWAEPVVMPTARALGIFGNAVSGESEFNECCGLIVVK